MIGGVDNARAALVALIAATGASEDGQALCAELLDRAANLLVAAPAEIIAAAGGGTDAVDRLAGIAALSTVCGACALCARGQHLAGSKPGPVSALRRG